MYDKRESRVLLRNFHNIAEYAWFSTDTHHLERWIDTQGKYTNDFGKLVRGEFCVELETTLCLYRVGELYLFINGNIHKITSSSHVELIREKERPGFRWFGWLYDEKDKRIRTWFRLFDNGGVVEDIVFYQDLSAYYFEHDFTPFVEEDDFDILLYIKNVVNTPMRRISYGRDE